MEEQKPYKLKLIFRFSNIIVLLLLLTLINVVAANSFDMEKSDIGKSFVFFMSVLTGIMYSPFKWIKEEIKEEVKDESKD